MCTYAIANIKQKQSTFDENESYVYVVYMEATPATSTRTGDTRRTTLADDDTKQT